MSTRVFHETVRKALQKDGGISRMIPMRLLPKDLSLP